MTERKEIIFDDWLCRVLYFQEDGVSAHIVCKDLKRPDKGLFEGTISTSWLKENGINNNDDEFSLQVVKPANGGEGKTILKKLPPQ